MSLARWPAEGRAPLPVYRCRRTSSSDRARIRDGHPFGCSASELDADLQCVLRIVAERHGDEVRRLARPRELAATKDRAVGDEGAEHIGAAAAVDDVDGSVLRASRADDGGELDGQCAYGERIAGVELVRAGANRSRATGRASVRYANNSDQRRSAKE